VSLESADMPGGRINSPPRRTVITRGVGFFALWIVLMQSAKPADLAFGAVATGIATWVSVRLFPPGAGSVNFGALLALAPHLLWESLRAGIDVARRALAPRLRLAPGFVRCPLNFPPGFTRNTFATITSLLPGTVPCGEDEGVLVYHCIDMTQPVVEELSQEERLLAKALVVGVRHG
jgi:multicomponent Na+:H+ antiporter subunit E